MIYFPILGALALASGTLLEKIVLKKIKPTLYQTVVFFAIVFVMLPFLFFFWKLDAAALELTNILIFLGVIVLSLLANYFVFYSMKWEKLSKLEPAKMMEPLFVILFAIIFSFIFSNELYQRNYSVIFPAVIAGLALIFSHIKGYHLKFNKYFRFAIWGSLFFALELVISRLILDFYSPITFYFLRSLFVFIFSIIIFKPNFSKIDKKSGWLILLTGTIWTIYRLILYYGYINLGVIETTLIVMLGPIFIYLFAWKFLKEKLYWKNIVASVVILASILYGVLA